MVDVSSRKNSITIKVESTNKKNSITATTDTARYSVSTSSDTAKYWSELSGQYANQARLEAEKSEQYANQASEIHEDIVELKDDSISAINQAKTEGVSTITDLVNESVQEYEDIAEGIRQDNSESSELARRWATSEVIVENIDYSSKYYAQLSQESAKEAINIANSANAKSDIAIDTSNEADATSNNALNIANQSNIIANSAMEIANTATDNVEQFKESIDIVLDSANKIKEIEDAVQLAVDSAELANQASENAIEAVDSVINSLESKADKTEIKNGKLTIQANGSTVATFTANQEGDSTANIVIPDSAQWGKITGTLSNQSDLQNALNGKLSTTGTADKALKDANGLQINTNYMRRTIGDAGIPATPTAPTTLAMVGKQACGNGNIAGGNLVALHKNTFFRCYERGSTITCNYDDKVANLGKTMCDGSFNGHYTQINPSTSFTSKPFVWQVTSSTQYEVSDVCRLHIYSHRLTDALNVTAFKIEAYIQDTLTNSKKWVTTYEYSGASKNIAQTGFGLYKTGYSSTSYYSIFGIRLTISGSPDTIFRMSQVQLVASRGTETLADSLQCVSNAGGKIWGNLEVTGNLKASNSYTKTDVYNKTEVDNIIKANKRLDLFDTILKDHILTYEESKGLGLQGTYVYKKALAGSRYGYPDFYNKVVEEFNASKSKQIVLGQQQLVLPAFTSNTVDGITISDSRGNTTNLQTIFNGTSAGTQIGVWSTYWININYNQNTIINSYTIQADNGGSAEYPKAWTLQGSNNGTNWTILDTRTAQTFALNESKTYTINTSATYSQYRIVFSDGVMSSNNGELKKVSFDVKSTGIKVYVHSNGHMFYNIADKEAIDGFFNVFGTAWFYGVDTANERIFLPRNNYFDQVTGNTSEVGLSVEAGSPNIAGLLEGDMLTYDVNATYKSTGALSFTTSSVGQYHAQGASGVGYAIKLDASKSNLVYGKSNTVQPNAVKKLLYICVGNTTSYEGLTDVVNQGMEILEQVNQGINNAIVSRVKLDGSNAQFPYITESYVNGTSWYKVWSDGWCEQGGQYYTASGSKKTGTITFLKRFANTDYYLQPGQAVNLTDTDPGYMTTSYAKNVTNASFVYITDSYNGNGGATNWRWEAKGYIA